jgi:hypothetical protein
VSIGAGLAPAFATTISAWSSWIHAYVQNAWEPGSRYAPLRNDGLPVSRASLTPWELYTQALLCTNEFVYVN